MMMDIPFSRRAFLARSLAVSFGLDVGWHHRCRHSEHRSGTHPDPRPGIDGSRVPTARHLRHTPLAVPAFNEVRRIPQIVDGIRCHCGCADDPALYSLLSCYEGAAMARDCDICIGQGRMAYRLHRAGKTLAEIRIAIDARYG